MSTLTSRPTVLTLLVIHLVNGDGWVEYEGELEHGCEEIPPDVITWKHETYVRYDFMTPMEHTPKYTYTAHYRPATITELRMEWAGRLREI
jgi:hypothetical protein